MPEGAFEELEKEYSTTKLIHVIQRGDDPPTVQWDNGLSENDVIANLVKALLFMAVDDYVMEIFSNMVEDSDDEDSSE